jgi:hypothetical protein
MVECFDIWLYALIYGSTFRYTVLCFDIWFYVLYMVVCFDIWLYVSIYGCIFWFNRVSYVFLLLCLFILIVMYVLFCLFCLYRANGTLRLPWLRFFLAFSSVARQTPGYNSQRRGTACTLLYYWYLCCSLYCLYVNVYCTTASECQYNCI